MNGTSRDITCASDADVIPLTSPQGCVLLDRYRVGALLGEGATARTYRGVDIATGAPVAIKFARPRLTEDQLDGLRGEFKALTTVSDPAIVEFIAHGEADAAGPRPFLVMAFVDGERLDTFLGREAPLSPDVLDQLIDPMVTALRVVHDAGIVHCDVSPANIIVATGADGRLRPTLIDFGLAVRMDETRATRPQVAGTPRYTAREQLRGKPEPRSDLFSVGAILWYALTGHPRLSAFISAGEVINHQLIHDSVEDPRSVRGGVPFALAQLTMQLLSTYPSGRPDADGLLKRWPQAVQSLRAAQKRTASVTRRGTRRLIRTSSFDIEPIGGRARAKTLPATCSRVLLVSSDHIDLAFLADHLTEFEVEVAANATRAFMKLRRGGYDAVIIAAAKHTYDGHHLVEAIREREGGAGIALLLAIDRADPGRLWARVGADAVLELNGHLPEMAGLLENLIRATRHGGAAKPAADATAG